MDFDEIISNAVKKGITTNNKAQAIKEAKKIKGLRVAVHCSYEVLRLLIKKKMINAILPSWPKKDYFNQRLSGLDVPLLKECTRNNIAIVFRFEDMLKVKKEERAIVVGKLSQNARLCMKFKTPYFICSGENKKDKTQDYKNSSQK